MFVETFIAQAAIERFDVGVLIWFARFDQAQLRAALMGQVTIALPQNFLPLSLRMILGRPRVSARQSGTRARPVPEIA